MKLKNKYKEKSINKIEKNKKSKTSKTDYRWTMLITMFTFIMSVALSFLLDHLLKDVNIFVGVIMLLSVILIGIIFDIIGVSVTSADQKLFHSMAANRIQEGKVAIDLIKNADKVSSFCNDVIGDMAGIISGALGASLLSKIYDKFNDINIALIGTLITASVAGFTVGGKSLGKSVAINKYREIIFFISKIILKFRNIFKNNK
ncbi:MAG: hypothetical protein ACLVKW_04495 [Fenollaria massiliensis]|uniref:Mg2+ and Co2+ transporter CorB n=1 Tax=Fenollaria massiliensis TaxID=938288 RepID=A0A9E7DKU9_9FIRM|nr:hypothetical protein [Fenollaria massiliensis]OFK79641.1 hypothetical protein HMPREF2800_04550 [Anaerosphaera sp. HMSC064C01]UQK59848.1 hypothetical protein M1R53_04155 [Fenollaria massiliensis]